MQIGDASIAMRHEQTKMGIDSETANASQWTHNHGDESAYAHNRRRNSRGMKGRHHGEEKREKPMQRERDGSIERDNGYQGNFAKSRNFRGGGAEAGPVQAK